MAATVYELFFGSDNAGKTPVFARFARADTHAAITAPAITEIGGGLYSFSWDWGTSTVTGVEYVATCNGVEVWDVLAPNPLNVYGMFFGTVNAGGSPAFTTFARADTHAALPPPTITEAGDGLYFFSWDWTGSAYTAIEYVVKLGLVELYDVISPVTALGAITPSALALDYSIYATAGDIVNWVAVRCGLAARADPFDGVDPNFVQLVARLGEAGQQVLDAFAWRHLIREATLTTSGSLQAYAMPTDYRGMLDNTGWNRSGRYPLIGPVTPQSRQQMVAQLDNVSIYITYALKGSALTFPIVPPNGTVLAFEYASKYWVKSAIASSPDLSAPTLATDLVLFDPLLIKYALNVIYLEVKGRDTLMAQARYQEALQNAIGNNKGAPTLSLNGVGPQNAIRFVDWVDWNNVPFTGWS